MTQLPEPHLQYIHAELLEVILDVMDLFSEPAIQCSLCQCLSVKGLQTAGDSLQQ